MKIIIINTQNKLVAKDMLIKAAIKVGMQYVEMEDEILIEDYLIKFKEKEHIETSFDLLIFEKEEKTFKPYIDLDSNPELQIYSIPKYKKIDYKKQSKIVNDKLKTKQRYNYRRR